MADCIGCGHCCRTAPCAMIQRIHGHSLDKCPELVYHDGRWWCRAIEKATGPLASEYRSAVAIGGGCSSSLFNSDREKIPTPAEVEARDTQDPFAPPPVDYKGVFQFVASSMSRLFMSGDCAALLMIQLRNKYGPDVALEFAHYYRENRSSFEKGMMG